jgi:hypothetical protein
MAVSGPGSDDARNMLLAGYMRSPTTQTSRIVSHGHSLLPIAGKTRHPVAPAVQTQSVATA